MYVLEREIYIIGWGTLYKRVLSNEDINVVKNALCEEVRKGAPVRELRITKEIGFDFKCAVALHAEEEE